MPSSPQTRFTGHGFLAIDKPAGKTSAQVIQPFKRLCSGKVGHVGTLDPFATGLLVLAIGHATKFAQYQLEAHKTYQACIQLGKKTDTQDKTGKILDSQVIPSLSEKQIQRAIKQKFIGEITQVAPKFSALKHEGKPRYHYARKGIEIPDKVRTQIIYAIDNIIYNQSTGQIQCCICCNGGTYIRALAESFAEELNCIGYLESLHRVSVACWENDVLHSPDSCSHENLEHRVQPIDKILQHIQAITLDVESITLLQHGQTIPSPVNTNESLFRIYSPDKIFFGLAMCHNNMFKARKILQ